MWRYAPLTSNSSCQSRRSCRLRDTEVSSAAASTTSVPKTTILGFVTPITLHSLSVADGVRASWMSLSVRVESALSSDSLI